MCKAQLSKVLPSWVFSEIRMELRDQCGVKLPLLAEEKSQKMFHSSVAKQNGRISGRLCIHGQGKKLQQDKLQTFQFKDRTQQQHNVEM